MRARPATPVTGAFEGTRACRWPWRGPALAATLVFLGSDGAWAATAHVQYVSSTNVYLDAGRGAGLSEGTGARVERQGRPIAQLLVEFVAQNSAACKVQSAVEPVRAGDDCVFTPGAPAGSGAPAAGGGGRPASQGIGAASTSAARGASSWPEMWSGLGAVRGRIATLYTESFDPAGTFRNPTFLADLRWSGRGREQVGMRARADRPMFAALGDAPAARAEVSAVRIYELQAHYRSPAQALEFEVGRLLPARLEPMGYVDGGGIRWRPAGALLFGVAGGRGSELGAREFRGSGRRLGGFVEASAAERHGVPRWRTLLAAALLEDPGITRRQFALLRTDAALGERVRAFQNLEVDVNPPWKRQLGEPRLALTAWSVSGHVQLQRRMALMLSVDARRGILLPEQRGFPASADRELQRGVHASVSLQLPGATSLRLGGDVRQRPGGRASTRSWDASLYAQRLVAAPFSGSVHASGYDADYGRGAFVDGSLSARAGSHLRFDTSAGTGTTRASASLLAGSAATANRSRWLRTSADLQAGRGIWLDAAGEWRDGGTGRELSLELGRSF